MLDAASLWSGLAAPYLVGGPATRSQKSFADCGPSIAPPPSGIQEAQNIWLVGPCSLAIRITAVPVILSEIGINDV